MGEILDPFNIIILVVAAVVLYRLYAVLGQRTGSEQPPPRLEPRRRDDDKPPPRPDDRRGENVIPLPGVAPRGPETVEAEPAQPATALDRALAHIVSIDRSFDKAQFLDGAAMAYEMIVTAFADGDRKALKPLLSPEVFEGFSRAIDERVAAGHTMQTTFVGIEKADIVEAGVEDRIARIKVRFVAEMVSVTRDKDGTVVAGDAAKVETLIDGWTFERALTSSDPNWVLVATETME